MQKETKWFASQRVNGKIPAHLANATELTRLGNRSEENRLQRRYGRRKELARQSSKKNMPGADGKLPFPTLARGTYHCVMY